ncbi:MAG: T9SS type A sorting domain-containing protein [Saprospiraceae bacterium]
MMKVMIKSMLTFGVYLAFTVVLFANGVLPTLQITKADFDKKISFVVEGLNGNASVRLTDKDDISLFSQVLEGSSSYHKIFDLTSLPNGAYILEFTTETRTVLQPFTITELGIRLKEADQKFRYIPIVKVKKGLLDVSLLNNELANIDIEISKIGGELVHEESLKNVLKVSRRFDVSNLSPGTYLVKVRTSEKTYYKEVQL